MLAVLVCLRGTEPLHLDQFGDAVRPRLGDGDQRGIGEDAIRGELLIGRLLAPPLAEHRHRVLVKGRRAVEMPANLAFGGPGE